MLLMCMKPADLSVTSIAYITHFTSFTFCSLIYSSYYAFSKKQSLAFQCSSELNSPFYHVIPNHTCLIQQGWRTEEAPRHLQTIYNCKRYKQSLATCECLLKYRDSVATKTFLYRDQGRAAPVLLTPEPMTLPPHWHTLSRAHSLVAS